MALGLPPPGKIGHDPATVTAVHAALSAVIAGQPKAVMTYTFYEEVDAWLGPWGGKGYPIAYGKLSNIAFTGNAKLLANEATRDWLWKTTILLQEAMRDWLVQQVKDKTIGSVDEKKLRAFAFDSHAKAYTEAGLSRVVMVAPELIPVIALIPAKEFNPTGPNFVPTVTQTLETIAAVAPQLPGHVLGPALVAVMPAHSGFLRNAARADRQRQFAQQALSGQLGRLQVALVNGELDDIQTLQDIIRRLALLIKYPTQTAIQLDDEGLVLQARAVVAAAEARQEIVQNGYKKLLGQAPATFREQFQSRFGGLLIPLRFQSL